MNVRTVYRLAGVAIAGVVLGIVALDLAFGGEHSEARSEFGAPAPRDLAAWLNKELAAAGLPRIVSGRPHTAGDVGLFVAEGKQGSDVHIGPLNSAYRRDIDSIIVDSSLLDASTGQPAGRELLLFLVLHELGHRSRPGVELSWSAHMGLAATEASARYQAEEYAADAFAIQQMVKIRPELADSRRIDAVLQDGLVGVLSQHGPYSPFEGSSTHPPLFLRVASIYSSLAREPERRADRDFLDSRVRFITETLAERLSRVLSLPEGVVPVAARACGGVNGSLFILSADGRLFGFPAISATTTPRSRKDPAAAVAARRPLEPKLVQASAPFVPAREDRLLCVKNDLYFLQVSTKVLFRLGAQWQTKDIQLRGQLTAQSWRSEAVTSFELSTTQDAITVWATDLMTGLSTPRGTWLVSGAHSAHRLAVYHWESALAADAKLALTMLGKLDATKAASDEGGEAAVLDTGGEENQVLRLEPQGATQEVGRYKIPGGVTPVLSGRYLPVVTERDPFAALDLRTGVVLESTEVLREPRMLGSEYEVVRVGGSRIGVIDEVWGEWSFTDRFFSESDVVVGGNVPLVSGWTERRIGSFLLVNWPGTRFMFVLNAHPPERYRGSKAWRDAGEDALDTFLPLP